MSTTVSLEVLLERVAENLWPGRFPQKITVTGGSTTTFIASSAAYASGHVNAYDGIYIYILDTTDDAAPEGEIARVVRGGYAAPTGTFEVSPAYTVAPASNDTGLFLYGLHVDELIDAANDIQRNLKMPRYLPLSLADDGDMESSGVTSWTDVGTPTTKAKVTTAANTLLRRALHVVTDAADEGVRNTTSIDVHEGKIYPFSVPVQVISGTVSVQLTQTDGTVIEEATGINDSAWTEARFTPSIPDNVEQVQTRVIGTSSTAEFYVGWVSLLPSWGGIINLPSAIADTSDLEQALWLPAAETAEAADTYVALSDSLQPFPDQGVLRDWRGANSHRVQLPSISRYPIFLRFRATGDTLSALTDTTEAPEELVVEGALAQLEKKLATRDKSRDHMALSLAHARTYQMMLDDLELARPIAKMTAQRRVSVSPHLHMAHHHH